MEQRKILFKAKRLDNGKWVEGSLLLSEKGKTCIGTMLDSNEENGSPVCFQCREVDPSTVCQFTGLTDEDYEDIWEGDLICADEEMEEVTYTDGAFMLGCYYLAEFAYGDNHTDLVRQCSKFDRKEGEK